MTAFGQEGSKKCKLVGDVRKGAKKMRPLQFLNLLILRVQC